MTKIVIPDDLTIFHSEAKRLREERDALKAELREVRMQSLADLGQAQMAWEAQKAAEEERDKALEVNKEQANQIAYWLVHNGRSRTGSGGVRMPYYSTTNASKDWRSMQVDELAKQFIARGVSKHTARAWAEAETPKDVTFTNCTVWVGGNFATMEPRE